jgi:hypothetical protein
MKGMEGMGVARKAKGERKQPGRVLTTKGTKITKGVRLKIFTGMKGMEGMGETRKAKGERKQP